MAETATEGAGPELPGPYGPVGRSAWLDVDWREHQRWVTAGGQRLNLIELGSGDPLLLVHGLGGNWQGWLENIPELAQRRHVVALDLPGFGHSPPFAGAVTIERYARLLLALCDELRLERPALVGSSMGGFACAQAELLDPGRASRLVLVAPAGISSAGRRRRVARAVAARTARLSAWTGRHADRLARRPGLRRLLLALAAADPRRLPPPLMAEQLRASGTPGFIAAVDAIVGAGLRERLGEIGCPTLVVWGAEDRMVPAADADVFGSLIPDVRVVRLPETGHMPMYERPAVFNRLVERFLDGEL
jgi:pimeloyl-ACP methyl ester carboxylesterase